MLSRLIELISIIKVPQVLQKKLYPNERVMAKLLVKNLTSLVYKKSKNL